MVKRILAGSWQALKKRFPDRQIYHRSDGHVQYFAVTTSMQVGAIGAAAAIAVWLTGATAGLVIDAIDNGSRDARFAAAIQEYQIKLEEARSAEAAAIAFLETRSDSFARTAGEFQNRHETLRRLMDFAQDLQVSERAASPSLEGGRIMMAAAPGDVTPRAGLLDDGSIGDPQGIAEARVAGLVAQQNHALSQAENAAEARLENLRAVLRLTGLRLEDILEEGRGAEAGAGGTGGPLIEISDASFLGSDLDPSDPFNARVTRIASRLLQVEELEAALTAAPLGMPLDVEFNESSGYGRRIDPFTRQPALHTGLDFTAYRGAPILAAAPGQVVYAGWRAGYGRTVEIDHGYGFKTRYAHLHTLDVRRGDDVEAGEKLGGMGNTGRSTATHLHYEVWFQGEHLNPERFLRAGHYVQ